MYKPLTLTRRATAIKCRLPAAELYETASYVGNILLFVLSNIDRFVASRGFGKTPGSMSGQDLQLSKHSGMGIDALPPQCFGQIG